MILSEILVYGPWINILKFLSIPDPIRDDPIRDSTKISSLRGVFRYCMSVNDIVVASQ